MLCNIVLLYIHYINGDVITCGEITYLMQVCALQMLSLSTGGVINRRVKQENSPKVMRMGPKFRRENAKLQQVLEGP